MKTSNLCLILLGAGLMMACTPKVQVVEAVTSTDNSYWQPLAVSSSTAADSVLVVDVTKTAQEIQGFGTCFNELGWTSLSELSQADRDDIFNELFTADGAGFTICRMPVGANDFSRDYYSYAPTPDDFELKDFTVANDEETLIPFIQAALQVKPDLKIWGSPWCPPDWMKYSKHYANTAINEETLERFRKMTEKLSEGERQAMTTMRMQLVPNGLATDKQIPEGKDAFIQEDKYFDAYARYFGKYIDAYKEHGIDIYMVMPQNEPNSAQPYPACTWTSAGLNRFMHYLGPEMKKRGVEVYLGTMERPNPALVDTLLNDPISKEYISGVGFQWAGKSALPIIAEEHPELVYVMTEQECGNGLNDWPQAMHAWDLMKHYIGNGVSIYDYWNTSLLDGGISRWGWYQNSLITVDKDAKTYKYTPDYYMLKHASHYVQPGAKYLETSGVEETLTFVNPDGSIVVMAANRGESAYTLEIQVGEGQVKVDVPANSVNTILINA